jgi:hypothetical protein
LFANRSGKTILIVLLCLVLLATCGSQLVAMLAPSQPASPTRVGSAPVRVDAPKPHPVLATTPTPNPILQTTSEPTPPPSPSPTPIPFLIHQEQPGGNNYPTLADLWEGRAEFALEVVDTGLPMGESDTLVMGNGELWSYVHASDRSAGTIDRCGMPVPFPGCTVIYRSYDGGYSFQHDHPPTCQFGCTQCPCTSQVDHIDQQQYPRVAYDGETLLLVYEYRGIVFLRRSADGLNWGGPEKLPGTGIWHLWYGGCTPLERIYSHPFVPDDYDCLVGGPPGLYVEDGTLFIFVGLGQNPGSMGCYKGPVDGPINQLRKCEANALFVGAPEYGPNHLAGAGANRFFDFRTISSANVQRIGDRYYMLYEGVRGPGPTDPGDTQFGLGLARSQTSQIDWLWDTFPGNPILVDMPGNIGLGHADLVVIEGQTILYTSLDGITRSRLALVWKDGDSEELAAGERRDH